MELAGPLGTLLGSVQWKRASSRGEAGTSGFLSDSDSDCPVPAVLGQESHASSCLRNGILVASRVVPGVSDPSSSRVWPWVRGAYMHAQSCSTLCDPLDYSPPGSSVHGILQARILEWVAFSSCRGFSPPMIIYGSSCIYIRNLERWY